MKVPDNMDDLLYFSRRTIGNGKVMAWVYKAECPKCKKGQIGKPINEKGKVNQTIFTYLTVNSFNSCFFCYERYNRPFG